LSTQVIRPSSIICTDPASNPVTQVCQRSFELWAYTTNLGSLCAELHLQLQFQVSAKAHFNVECESYKTTKFLTHISLYLPKYTQMFLFYDKYMRMVASLPLQFNEVLSICMTATSNIKFINWRPGTNELLPQNYRTPGDTIGSVHNGGHVYKLISISKFQDIC